MRVGFAGAGNMAAAMARGWAAAEGGPGVMLFSDIDRERAQSLAAEVQGETRDGLAELGSDSDVVVLAVKPAAVDDAARGFDGTAKALVSVVAATPVARLADAFPGIPLVRVMPNQPVQVRRGVLCCARPQGVPGDVSGDLLELLGKLGRLVEVDEPLMEAAMAVMSCSPAYFAVIAQGLARAGEREGLDAATSAALVGETMAGTAELLRVRDPEAIRDAVASPGGATEAGLQALEDGGLDQALQSAVDASLERYR